MGIKRFQIGMLAIALAAAEAKALAPSQENAVLIVSDDQPTIPAIDLYQAVIKTAPQDFQWKLYGDSQRVAELLQNYRPAAVGALPIFSKKYVRPPTKSEDDTADAPVAKNLIAPVQYVLDTLALKGALMVECLTDGDAAARQCSVYYYDRAKEKITAAASKVFHVPIHDTTKWSYVLVQKLSEGMERRETLEKKQIVSSMLKEDEELEPYKPMLEVGAFGESYPGFKNTVGYVPSLSIVLGSQNESFLLGLSLQRAQALAIRDASRISYKSTFAGLSFAAQSPALSSIVWQLFLESGWMERRFSELNASGEVDGAATSTDIASRIGPGLEWQVKTDLAINARFEWSRHFLLDKDTQGDNIDLPQSGFITGVHLKYVF